MPRLEAGVMYGLQFRGPYLIWMFTPRVMQVDRGPDPITEQPIFSLVADTQGVWEDLKSNRGT